MLSSNSTVSMLKTVYIFARSTRNAKNENTHDNLEATKKVFKWVENLELPFTLCTHAKMCQIPFELRVVPLYSVEIL